MISFDLKMKCDRCHRDQNEVLILRKERFYYKEKQKKKYHRVCLRCAKRITLDGVYDLGNFWRGVILAGGLQK